MVDQMLYKGFVYSVFEPDFEYTSKLSKYKLYLMDLNQLLAKRELLIWVSHADHQTIYAA